MKKRMGLIIVVFIACWVVIFSIDYSRITNNRKPIFSTETAVYKDGGSTEYLGAGYKIIKYANFTENDEINWEVKCGPWFMKFNNEH